MLGPGARIGWAFRCFFALLFTGRLPDELLDRFRPRVPEAVPATTTPVVTRSADESGDRAVQLLAILQRDARLVDFLQEEIGPYQDAQIGAAVRDVHGNCRTALARYLALEPLLSEAEGERVRVEPGADPARTKVIGAVSGAGPQHGVVRHRGWRVTHVALPPLPPDGARLIVAPAEVEVA
jgi:hypothetical protein